MKTLNIRGKEYVPVSERIKYFREKYKGWKIHTEIVELSGKAVLMKASILDEKNNVISVGHAFEMYGSTNVNKTSHIENCETSAIGRALGILGIGIDASIASADELMNALLQQESGSRLQEMGYKKSVQNNVSQPKNGHHKKLSPTQFVGLEIRFWDGETDVFDKAEANGYKFTEWQENKIDDLVSRGVDKLKINEEDARVNAIFNE